MCVRHGFELGFAEKPFEQKNQVHFQRHISTLRLSTSMFPTKALKQKQFCYA
jgi:hypothetical protein